MRLACFSRLVTGLSAAILLMTGCDTQPTNLGAPVAVVKEKGPTHGLIGLEFSQKSPKILRVLSGSPAEEAGIIAGDEIVSVGGQTVQSFDEYTALIKKTSPGDMLKIVVRRGEAEHTMNVRMLDFAEFFKLTQAAGQRNSTPVPGGR